MLQMERADCRDSAMILSILYPGLFFWIFFALNLLIWSEGSAGAVPFGTFFALLVLWFGISMPSVFCGSVLGFRQEAIQLPVLTSPVPRVIPDQKRRMNPVLTALLGGCMPFLVVFTELSFIMSSIWLHKVYYVFGFLLLVLHILVVVSAEVSIIFTYLDLASEDYQWWWRSFLTAGSSGLYFLLYAFIYFFASLRIDKLVSIALYFGYMFIAACMFSLFTGAVGMISTFYFVRAIYGSIKID